MKQPAKPDRQKKHDIDVVIDRLVIKPSIRNRLADSLELALSQSEGTVTIDVLGKDTRTTDRSLFFNEKAACHDCKISFPDLSPASFSFNSPQGACLKCDGLGSTSEFDPELIVPNPRLSLREGAVALWANRNTVHFYDFLESLTAYYRVDIHTPYEDLPDHFQQVLLYGSNDEEIPFFFERGNRRFTYRNPLKASFRN